MQPPASETDLERLADAIAKRVSERLGTVDPRPLFTPKTLAERLSISERTVREMLSGPDPVIPSFRVAAGARRIAPADVDAYLRRQRDRDR